MRCRSSRASRCAGGFSVWGAYDSDRLSSRFDDPSRRSLRREFATEGQRFYFTIARDESDIWAVELLRK